MEQLLERALASIHRGQFSSAKNFLQEILKATDDSENSQKEEAYKALLDIHKHEKKISEYQVCLTEYLSYLNSQKKFEESLSIISELEKNESKFIEFFSANIQLKKIAALEGLGHFQKSLEEIEHYLKSLLEIKNYDLAQTYVEAVIKKFPYQIQWQLYQVKISIGQYQTQKAIEKLNSIILGLDVEKQITWCADYINLLSENQDDSKISSDYFEVLNCRNFQSKQDYSKLINTIINSGSFELFFQVCKTLANTGRFNLAKSFLTYLEKNHKKQLKKQDKGYIRIQEVISKKRKENFDCKNLSSETIQENKIERLKIDLQFSKKYDSEDSYIKLLKKVTKLDPFFVDEGDDEAVGAEVVTKTTKVSKKEKPANADEIFRNLLSEISYYSSKNSGKENILDDLEKKLIKTIEVYQNEILDSNYYDYILMLYSFKLYDSALLLVNNVKEKLSTGLEHLKAYLEISYIEIVLKNEMGKTYDSLEILNFILTQLPLSRDEKICFLYMTGESYFKLGQGREALKYYRKILKLTDGYRLTKDRVKLLEKA